MAFEPANDLDTVTTECSRSHKVRWVKVLTGIALNTSSNATRSLVSRWFSASVNRIWKDQRSTLNTSKNIKIRSFH